LEEIKLSRLKSAIRCCRLHATNSRVILRETNTNFIKRIFNNLANNDF
jgi:hypothetical protein